MGPHTANIDPLFEDLRQLREYRRAHPDVIFTYPSESPSELWEVSLPGASAMSFSGIGPMLAALEEYDRVAARNPPG